jgi:hypothetical protein
MQVLLWALGIIVAIQSGVIAFLAARLWAHVEKCSTVSDRIGRINADVERMKQDIGTHDTGLRGNVHQTASLCMAHEMRIAVLERKKP